MIFIYDYDVADLSDKTGLLTVKYRNVKEESTCIATHGKPLKKLTGNHIDMGQLVSDCEYVISTSGNTSSPATHQATMESVAVIYRRQQKKKGLFK